jgi:zinc/manganese transport system permease protein
MASVGGVLLAAGSSVPISPYITSISFAIYLICRSIGARRPKQAPKVSVAATVPQV